MPDRITQPSDALIRRFFKTRLVDPLKTLLRQGLSPEKLSLSVALGLALGIFPMLGTTTVLCFLAAWTFRLNQPAIQLINYFAYTLQLALFLPFFKAGAWLFHMEPIDVSISEIHDLLAIDPQGTIARLWMANVHAVVVWMLVSPVLAAVTYATVRPVFRRIARSFHSHAKT